MRFFATLRLGVNFDREQRIHAKALRRKATQSPISMAANVHNVRPQRPQNFVPEGYVTPQPGHSTSTGRGADQAIWAPPSDAPQRPQNFVPAG